MGYIVHLYSFRQTFMINVMNYATLLAEMCLGGGGGLTYMCPNLSHTFIIVYQTDQYKNVD